MVTRISLDGSDWRCKAYLGEEWRWRRAFAADSNDTWGWLPATVPGSVIADLVRAGAAPDPLVDRNSRGVEWAATRSWVYRRDLSLPQPLDGRRVVVHFEGIDHAGEVFWNGRFVGAHEGMFLPAEFDVTHLATPGTNHVAVVLAPAPASEPQVGRTARVGNAKSRMTYGWDFCPRLVHLGLWDRVWVDVIDGVRITGVQVQPRLSADLARADVAWEATIEATTRRALFLEVAVLRDGERVTQEMWHGRLGETPTSLRGCAEVPDPALWWPNEHGEQPLYALRVRIRLGDAVHDEWELSFGIRSLNVVPNASAPPTARPYTFVVNGERVYLRGWNWVPMDVHHGVEDPDRLAHLLALAARAHVNLLRVWGGGLIEKEAFYDACDRLGIMVWQEFPLSSSGIASTPSRDPEYLDRIAAVAESAIPRRSHHPSLGLWCGGNELAAADGRPLDDAEPVLAVLHEAVTRLDPGRGWLPTSPSGPHATCTLDNIARDPDGQHDVHGPWEHQGIEGQRTLYDRSTSLLHSEFGVEGMTNPSTLEVYLSPQHRLPADRTNPHWVHRGDWWINTTLVGDCFPGAVEELEALSRASQFLQAEGLRYGVEANRRRQWRNSGSIPWQFNEPYPNGFCTSAVDYRGRPKSAYYAVAEAYRSPLVSAAFPTIAWGEHEFFTASLWISTGRHEVRTRLAAALLSAHGSRHHEQARDVAVPRESSRCVMSITCDLDDLTTDVFWLDLHLDGNERAGSRYTFSRTADLAPLMSLAPTTLTVTRAAEVLHIRNSGEVAALGLRAVDGRHPDARGYVQFGAGGLCLMPAEERLIEMAWTAAPEDERQVAVQAWNTRPVHA